MTFEAEQPAGQFGSIPSLPKGGGAIRGIGEKFQANPASGTASVSVPLPISKARALTPQHELSYDSGSGNSAFGLGWQVDIPTITRKVDKCLPAYEDVADTFALSGVELVLELKNGQPMLADAIEDGKSYQVRRYFPRSESAYARIECWRDTDTGKSHWRVWSAGATVSIFGFSADACISDPAEPTRIFSWCLERVFDSFGNLTQYEYVRDDDADITTNDTAELRRLGQTQAQIFPSLIYYGNRTPFNGATLAKNDFCFRTAFDYGESEALQDRSAIKPWRLRSDAFSTYRAGFEIRTRRLCQRIVTEHFFEEIGPDWECVASLELTHSKGEGGHMLLVEICTAGFTRGSPLDSYEVETAPSLTLRYTEADIHTEPRRLENSSGDEYRVSPDRRASWIDLAGNALPGLVSEVSGSLMFEENLGDGIMAGLRPIISQPTLAGLGNLLTIEDRLRSGRPQIFAERFGLSGYYATNHPDKSMPLKPPHRRLTTPAGDRDLKPVDLTGNGISDLLRTDGANLVWYRASHDGSFETAQRVAIPVDARTGPAFLFSDAAALTFLADMSGDGLLDVVKIGPRSVRYWPNLGYGRFSAEVVMERPPSLASEGDLNADHLRLVDLNGNGLTDILWIGDGEVTFWANQSGNGFAEPNALGPILPDMRAAHEVGVVDILGCGTACLTWAGHSAGQVSGARVYVDLYAGTKSNLLCLMENAYGGSTQITYRPSTHYAREAAEAGRPWATTLHFPVHCLASVKTRDHITGYSLSTSYSYHHGYYDPVDREFCGFARVDQFDTEAVVGDSGTARAFLQPTCMTKTWFHTGARLSHARLEEELSHEFFDYEGLPLDVLPCELPHDLTDREWSEAQRALRGSMLRSETYALDHSEKEDVPYTVTFSQMHLRRLQPAANLSERDVPAVFQKLQRQTVSFNLDRVPSDPRVSQEVVLEWDAYGIPLRTMSLAHGRWGESDADIPNEIAEKQRTPMATIADQRLTAGHDPDHQYVPLHLWNTGKFRHLPRSYFTQSTEIRGLSLAHYGLAETADLRDQIEALPSLNFTNQDDVKGQRRVATSCAYFSNDTLNEALPLGEIGQFAIVHHSETLAFTQDCLSALYDGLIAAEQLNDAGYVEQADGTWWAPSGTSIHSESPASRFYLPIGSRDAFGTEARFKLDAYLLLPVEAEDALGNITRAVNDYRRLGPVLTRDANHNWSAVRFNALGQPLAIAAMGKVSGVDTPTGYEHCEGSTLDRPSVEFQYDLAAWVEGRGPIRITTTAFATHGSSTQGTRLTLVTHDYTSGLGGHVMSKVQQAPGQAWWLRDAGVIEEIDTRENEPPSLRWLGNGRAILNNKGKPIRQYEPYFSVTPDYEDDAALVEMGISAFPFYDAAQRPVGQLNPDGTWSKLTVTPWRTEIWDAADTCLLDPLSDPDLGSHFAGLPPDIYSQTWYAARKDGQLGDAEARAAEAGVDHAATPAVSHFDALGRPVIAIADNGFFGKVKSSSRLDIEGNTLAAIDDHDRKVVVYRYNLLPSPDDETPKPALWQSSMDQGSTRSFPDCLSRPCIGWDAFGRRSRTTYDHLSRPVELWLEPGGGEAERRIALTEYGESASDPEATNLRGRAWRSWDSAGFSETQAHDFQGNLEQAYRRIIASSSDSPHWPDAEDARIDMLAPETYHAEAEHDALGRPIRSVLPHMPNQAPSVHFPIYDEGGALKRMEAVAAGGEREIFVEEITYDAKGQRQSIRYGNSVETRYSYDPRNYRLRHVTTVAAGDVPLQDLRYIYDALGNVTEIRDATQPVIHYSNQQIEPVARYTYDALSRLIEATGREHIAQSGAPEWQTGIEPGGQIGDHQQLRHYKQLYSYDSVGNIRSMRHVADGFGWTRHYGYLQDSNRLVWTNVGRDDDVGATRYFYNAAGTMQAIGPVVDMALNAAEQMVRANLGGGGQALYTYDGGGGRVRKRIEHQGHIVEERLYLGGFEIYRKWVGGVLQRVRETMHIGDDAGIIALVETETHDASGLADEPERLVRYQMSNHLGSATIEIDEAGQVLTREEYHPYGTTAYSAAAPGRTLPPKRYRYTGMEKDEETGLQYHGARYYAPWLARWTAADPIGIGDGLNVYAYVKANPVGKRDRSGTSSEDDILDCEDVPNAVPNRQPGPIDTGAEYGPNPFQFSDAYETGVSFDLSRQSPSGAEAGCQSPSLIDAVMVRFAGIYLLGYGAVWATGENEFAAGFSDEFTFEFTRAMRERHFQEYENAMDYGGNSYYYGEWVGFGAQTIAFAGVGAPEGQAVSYAMRSMADDAAFAIMFHESDAYAAGGPKAAQLRNRLMASLWTAAIPDGAIRSRLQNVPNAPGLYAITNDLYNVAYGGISSVSVRGRLMSGLSGGHDKAYALLQLPQTRLRYIGLHTPGSETLRWVETMMVHSRLGKGNYMLNSLRSRYSMKAVPNASSTPSVAEMEEIFGAWGRQISNIQEIP